MNPMIGTKPPGTLGMVHEIIPGDVRPAARWRDWLRLLRPKHWIKNVFVLAPVLFSEHLTQWTLVADALIACAAFCLMSSALYIVNDIVDRANDAAHPRKRLRPIAAGRISIASACLAAALLAAGSLLLGGLVLGTTFLAFTLAYLGNTLAYIVWLKFRVIVDILSISIGFVIRLLAGCTAVDVEPSSWLIVCGFSLALVLGFGKRRVEVEHENVTNDYRSTLISYSREKLNIILAVCTAVCLLAYMLYTVAPETVARHGTNNLVYTVPLVAYGLFRYLFKTLEGSGDGPTDILVADPVFALTGLAWGAAVAGALAWK